VARAFAVAVASAMAVGVAVAAAVMVAVMVAVVVTVVVTVTIAVAVQYPAEKYVGLGGGHVHDRYSLHINQLFYPAMLRGIGVDLCLFKDTYKREGLCQGGICVLSVS
jgi:hypothetical protein